ncbi:hypothetical protein V8C40DRAFT_157807 [Trichoderma camerunense]
MKRGCCISCHLLFAESCLAFYYANLNSVSDELIRFINGRGPCPERTKLSPLQAAMAPLPTTYCIRQEKLHGVVGCVRQRGREAQTSLSCLPII